MNKQIVASLAKSTNSNSVGTFVLNEESPDRMGDIIHVKGWQLGDFRRNNVALWQHDADKPIGTWENVRVKGKQLLGDLRLGSTRLAQMARQLIEDDILKAVSVGFRPIDWEPIDEKKPYGGWIIKSADLLEVSLVSVPAHPNALRVSKSLGLSAEEQKLIFVGASKSPSFSAASGIHPSVQRALEAREATRKLLESR